MSISSVFIQVTIAAGAFCLGMYTGHSGPQVAWLFYVGLFVLSMSFLFFLIFHWLEHRGTYSGRLYQRVTEADQWDNEQKAERYVKLLKEFWQSDAGKAIRRTPFLANSSVRISRIGSGYVPESHGGFGTYSVQFSETYVAHIQPALSLSRWTRFKRWLEHSVRSR